MQKRGENKMNLAKFFVFAFGMTISGMAAHAQTEPASLNSKLPIEISSDSLEVLQRENKAIFSGNVIAVQGTVRLKSDKMIVHYKQKSQQPQPAPAAKPSATPSADMGAITQIEVEGHVLIATPQESAQGDKGDYEVATRTIHLFGSNVVLTRDKNIMRGTALEYNMETGRSILTNGTDLVSGKSTGTRVRGVFVPNQENNAPAKQQKP
jgi:lipopolysaccharide export system protein LptA